MQNLIQDIPDRENKNLNLNKQTPSPTGLLKLIQLGTQQTLTQLGIQEKLETITGNPTFNNALKAINNYLTKQPIKPEYSLQSAMHPAIKINLYNEN